MLTSLLLTLAVGAAPSQARTPVPGHNIRPRVFRSDGPLRTTRLGPQDFAFFEAFPNNGAGVQQACQATAPTGAKGETLTFTRASNGTCTKTTAGGLATTGIANGDLVVLSSNVARVEYDSAGTLGLLVEAARTNSIIRSEEFETGWTLAAGGVPSPGAPVRTVNAAVAPDGTTTAEQIDFGATSGTGFGVIYNTAGRTSTAASWTHSLYVKGVSGSGTIYLMSTPGGSYNSAACAYVSTSWTRCAFTGTETVATWYYQIGVDLRDGTQTAKAAQSVYIWGAQGEAGAYATSYIPTAGVAVARAAEAASFAFAQTTPPTGSMAISVITHAIEDNTGFLSAEIGTTFKQSLIRFGGERAYIGGTPMVGPLAYVSALTSHRLVNWWDATSTNLIIDGATTSGAAGTPATVDVLRVGNYSGVQVQPGIYSRVCADPDPSRCR